MQLVMMLKRHELSGLVCKGERVYQEVAPLNAII